MCGLSGAGKTTFAKQFVRDNLGVDYFSIDDFYANYTWENNDASPWENPDASFRVWIRFFEAIHDAEQAGRSILIDTNAPTIVKRYQFIDWFPDFDEHNLIYIAADTDTCRANNKARYRVVPDDVFETMVEEFDAPGYIRLSFDKRGNFESGALVVDEDRWDNVQAFYNHDNELSELDICY